MRKLRAHPVLVTALAFVLAAAAVVAIAAAFGFGAFAAAWAQVHLEWLALVVVAELLAIGAYVACYRAVAKAEGGPRVELPLVVRVVTAGFGPLAAGGGFALDKRALHAIEDDEQAATVRVLGLGALEWALLAPVTWISAIVLLADGDSRPMPSLLWPWVVAVPVGFALGLWFATPERYGRIAAKGGRWRTRLAAALRAVGILRSLAGGFGTCWKAWVGMGLYWALDIASFYGALRFVGLSLNLGEVIVGYATGYALTRRSMPLGGAGVTEVLMTFALHWVGLPVAPALAATVVYRLFNFALPTLPAVLVRPRVKPLLDAADLGRTPARAERRRAAAPLRAIRR